MPVHRVITGMTFIAALSWAALANAQVDDAESDTEANDPDVAAESEVPTEIPEELFQYRVMDEIIVVAGPDGQSPFEMELQRQEQMRERIYAEMRLREREQAEAAWRQSDPDLENPASRIRWGYNPQAQQRMRRGNEGMWELPIDRVKPATVFRAEF